MSLPTKMPPLPLFMETLLKLHFIHKNFRILVITSFKMIRPAYSGLKYHGISIHVVEPESM